MLALTDRGRTGRDEDADLQKGDGSEVDELKQLPPEKNGYDCLVVYTSNQVPYKGGDKNACVDFVFVHGITGSQTATWSATDSKGHKVLWPRDLLPNNIPACRVIMYGYDADVVNFWAEASQNRLDGHARDLFVNLGALRRETATTDRPIIFVVHSMGGLVVADALHRAKDSLDKHEEDVYRFTYAIAFLGTPHLGAQLASWASLGATFLSPFKRTNKSLVKVLQTRSEALRDIQRRFHLMVSKRAKEDSQGSAGSPYPIQLYCFFEALALKGAGKVVPEESAVLDGWGSASVHANHMGMTRFSDSDDDGYKRVLGRLDLWVSELRQRQGGAAVSAAPHTSIARTSGELPTPVAPAADAPTYTTQGSPSAAVLAQPEQQQHQVAELPVRGHQQQQESTSPTPSALGQAIGANELAEQQNSTSSSSAKRTKAKKAKNGSKPQKATGPTFNFNQTLGGRWQVTSGNINNRGPVFGKASKRSNEEEEDSEEEGEGSSEESSNDE